MKKKIMGIIAILAVVAVAGYNVLTSHKDVNLSDLLLANVEALADSEDGNLTVTCYCKTNWFTPNICSANSDGTYCGGSPCSDHDGDCR